MEDGATVLQPFDEDVAQVLRRAVRLAGPAPVTPALIRTALALAETTPLPRARLRPTREAHRLLARAGEVAATEGRIAVAHLVAAADEQLAAAAGADIERLRFQRWRAERACGLQPGRRVVVGADGLDG